MRRGKSLDAIMKSQEELDKEYFNELKQPLRQRSELNNNENMLITIFAGEEYQFEGKQGDRVHGWRYAGRPEKGNSLVFTSYRKLEDFPWVMDKNTGLEKFAIADPKKFDPANAQEITLGVRFDFFSQKEKWFEAEPN